MSTFEITLVLQQEKNLSVSVKNWIRSAVTIGEPKQAYVVSDYLTTTQWSVFAGKTKKLNMFSCQIKVNNKEQNVKHNAK